MGLPRGHPGPHPGGRGPLTVRPIQATRLSARCIEFLAEQLEFGTRASAIRFQSGRLQFTDLTSYPSLIEPDAQRPLEQRWMAAAARRADHGRLVSVIRRGLRVRAQILRSRACLGPAGGSATRAADRSRRQGSPSGRKDRSERTALRHLRAVTLGTITDNPLRERDTTASTTPPAVTLGTITSISAPDANQRTEAPQPQPPETAGRPAAAARRVTRPPPPRTPREPQQDGRVGPA